MIEELIRNSMNHYIESFEEIQKEYGEMLVREYMDIQKSKIIKDKIYWLELIKNDNVKPQPEITDFIISGYDYIFEEIQKEYGEMLVREYMDIQKSKVIEYYKFNLIHM